LALTSKDNGGFQNQHPAQTQQARQDHDEENTTAGQRDVLPHQYESASGGLLQRYLKEARRHSGSERKADESDVKRLQQDHADEPPIGHTHGLERAELF